MMKLFSYIKKFFMGTSQHSLQKFIAKRKFWIEWEILFPSIPSDLEFRKTVDKQLKDYIEEYLKHLFNEKSATPVIPKNIAEIIEQTFELSKTGGSVIKDVKVEYRHWNEGEQLWKDIPAAANEDIESKIKAAIGNKWTNLSFTVYSTYWMSILKTEWSSPTGNTLVPNMPHVLSYRGWFEGKNGKRLTDDQAGLTASNSGTMNPPNPPPPPQ